MLYGRAIDQHAESHVRDGLELQIIGSALPDGCVLVILLPMV